MTNNVHRESAKIYTFPARGRFAEPFERIKTDAMTPSQAASAALDSAWYHEDALRDADQSRKN